MTIMEGLVLSFCSPSMTQMLKSTDDSRVQDFVFGSINYKTAFTQTFTDGNFTYNPEDVIQSSFAGWLDYGYK